MLGLQGDDSLLGDSLYGAQGRDIVLGGQCRDVLLGGGNEAIHVGFASNLESSVLSSATQATPQQLRTDWTSSMSFSQRVALAERLLTPTLTNDLAIDQLYGHDGLDLMFYGMGDVLDDIAADIKRRVE